MSVFWLEEICVLLLEFVPVVDNFKIVEYDFEIFEFFDPLRAWLNENERFMKHRNGLKFSFC